MFSKSVDEDLDKDYIESFIRVLIGDEEKSEWIFDETINILKEKYNKNFDDIKI